MLSFNRFTQLATLRDAAYDGYVLDNSLDYTLLLRKKLVIERWPGGVPGGVLLDELAAAARNRLSKLSTDSCTFVPYSLVRDMSLSWHSVPYSTRERRRVRYLVVYVH